MHQVAIRLSIEMPAVHLARRHKIYLVRLYIKTGKVYGMDTCSFREQYQVIERMAVLPVKMLVFAHIRGETGYHQVLLGMTMADAVYIVYRYPGLCHCTVVLTVQSYERPLPGYGIKQGYYGTFY